MLIEHILYMRKREIMNWLLRITTKLFFTIQKMLIIILTEQEYLIFNGKDDEALKDYGKALELDSTNTFSINNRAVIYDNIGKQN